MSGEKKGKSLFIISLILIFIAYALFNSRLLIAGPKIEIFEPKDGSSLEHKLIELKGVAKNTSFITLNDNQIFLNEEGLFNEKVLLNNGLNIIKISSKDRFNRSEEIILNYIYNGEEFNIEDIPPNIDETTASSTDSDLKDETSETEAEETRSGELSEN